MTSVTTTTKLTCELASGKKVDLTADDCVAILNAMARRRMLTVMAEDIPDGYSEVWSEECCAWKRGGEGDDEIILAVNAADFVCATPTKKATAKRKKPAKKK